MADSSLDKETVAKVLREVEFYFSDSNLSNDAFLMHYIGESPDGMVDLSLICAFARMKNTLKLGWELKEIPEDTLKAVAKILRSSSTIKVTEDGKKIGRATELKPLKA